jgi:8-oxo-dGTP pyrophosphatase MutT (NUDIX family)
MINRHGVIVSIYAFNWEGSKILVGKQLDQNSWNIIGGKLEYGEKFDD